MTIYAWSIGDRGEPGVDIVPVTKSDSADQSNTVGGVAVVGYRALRANTAGVIKVTMASGEARSLNFLAGETRVGFFQRVWSSVTTVTDIEGHV